MENSVIQNKPGTSGFDLLSSEFDYLWELSANTEGNENSSKEKASSKIYNKIKRQSGQGYITKKGKIVRSREMKHIICQCHLKCSEKLPEDERKKLHKQFWKLQNWNLQSDFILQTVTTSPPKRRTRSHDSRLKFVRKYYLNEKQVCRKVYLSTLDINHMRVDYVLRFKNNLGVCAPDQRGQVTPNKTPQETVQRVNNFLDSIPKYKSPYHYGNHFFFHPDLTKAKLYQMYQENCSPEEIPLSQPTFKKILKDFNVNVYMHKTDTCQQCEIFNQKIKDATNNEEKLNLKLDMEKHHQKAEAACRVFEMMSMYCREDNALLCFSFDFQKLQPLPYLNTTFAFYKRPLWLYNLGINTRHNNQGYMCIWTEAEGKMGSQELCSSLLKFLEMQNLCYIKKIHSFSDCYGGPDRKKLILVFMMWFVENNDVKEWEHTYMESGHSYLPNDSDFALIEKSKRKYGDIYTFDTWIDLIENSQAKQPFIIIQMKDQIKETNYLLNIRKLPSLTEEGKGVNWLNIKYFRVQKGSTIVQFKTSSKEDEQVQYIDVPLLTGIFFKRTLAEADTSSFKISREKYEDLQSILDYIPPAYHHYYENLPH